MQSPQMNPFPMSDSSSDKPTPQPTPTPPVAAQPAASPAPQQATFAPSTTTQVVTPATSLFVQPTAEPASTISLKGPLGKIEGALLKLFSRPGIQMPEFVGDMISRFLPWLTLMICFILAPLLLIGIAMGGFLGFITSFYELNTNVFYWVTIVLLIAQLVLMGMAIPKLLREKRAGWQLLFIAALLGGVTVLTNIFAQFVQPILGTLVGLATFTVILYILFQARSYYTD